MTTAGYAFTTALSTANTAIDVGTQLRIHNSGGQKTWRHSGLWLINLGTAAADVIWFRPDAVAAASGGPDCWPLHPGARVMIPITDAVNAIVAAGGGTPSLFIGGDWNGQMIYS